jgi:nucleoside-diphosphate-sugar epimerase
MRIIVTGSESFIGRYLVRELRNVGHSIHSVDGGQALDAVGTVQPQAIVHLASISSGSPGEVVAGNTGFTASLAHRASLYGARMIVGSTSDVYGDVYSSRLDEHLGPYGVPVSITAHSMKWREQVAEFYAPKEFTALRFASIYGPGMEPAGGEPHEAEILETLRAVKEDEAVLVCDNDRISWCWVEDAARGARMAIDLGSGLFNVGRDDDWVSMEDAARRACELLGRSPDLVAVVPGDTPRMRVSDSRLRRLGWRPEVSLEEGMARTLAAWSQEEVAV